MSNRKRYAIVGTGGRAGMYVGALVGQYHETNELVGLCDLSQVRMDWHIRQIKGNFDSDPIPTYHADDQ